MWGWPFFRVVITFASVCEAASVAHTKALTSVFESAGSRALNLKMAACAFFVLLGVLSTGWAQTPNTVYLNKCDRLHSGLTTDILDLTERDPCCKFFACDNGQLNRLHCAPGSKTCTAAHITSIFARYYRYAAGSGGSLTPLWVELNGDIPIYNTQNQIVGYSQVNEAMFGSAISLVHQMTLSISDLYSRVPSTIWAKLTNLKILNLSVSGAAGLSGNAFPGAAGLESLTIDTKAGAISFDPRIIVNLPSLRCFNLKGTNFLCDCAMQAFVQKSPIWTLNDTYENLYLTGNTWGCGSIQGAKCGAQVAATSGHPLAFFVLENCPSIQLPMIPFLQGTEIFCDFTSLKVKLRNVGQTDQIDFLLGGSDASECRGRLANGVVAFSASTDQCNTTVDLSTPSPSNTQARKDLSLKNKIVIRKKTKPRNSPVSTNKGLVIKPVGDKVIPIECKILYKRADISEVFGVATNNLGPRYWDQQVTIQMDRIQSAHIMGRFEFDVTLTAIAEGDWSFFVENCWATAGADPNGERGYLIENGCPMFDGLESEVKESGRRRVRQRFSMPEFQLGDNPSSEIHIHCDVDPCNAEKTNCKPAVPAGSYCKSAEPEAAITSTVPPEPAIDHPEEAETEAPAPGPAAEDSSAVSELPGPQPAQLEPDNHATSAAARRGRSAFSFNPGTIFRRVKPMDARSFQVNF